MLDIKKLRKELPVVIKNLEKRGFQFDEALFLNLESNRKALQAETEQLQHTRNEGSKQIGLAKANGQEPDIQLVEQLNQVNDQLSEKAQQLHQIQDNLENYLATVPNLLHDSVPVGQSENDNFEEYVWGEVPQFSFKPKAHEELGAAIQGIDLELSAKISGSRFAVLARDIAKLHRALAQFMLELHVEEHGYLEVNVPLLVKSDAMFGTGQFPKMVDDAFGTKEDDLWLIPTGEVPVTNFVRDQIIDSKQLPLKYVCHSVCFRREAGSYGKDTAGILRRHQFEKVELVQIVKPEKSYEALEELTNHAETVLKKLKLPFRRMSLCSGDMGFHSAKTYDLEVWLPAQNTYREISSCSNTEAFQARRMQARWRDENKKVELLHTLNGSGLAVGRALIAVMENYQDKSGNIIIPEVLIPYMRGQEIIKIK